ncbi:MAG: rRNA maturation RNase YbeY [Thermoguttaceae bacterium]
MNNSDDSKGSSELEFNEQFNDQLDESSDDLLDDSTDSEISYEYEEDEIPGYDFGESTSNLFIEIIDEQEECTLNKDRLREVAEQILADGDVICGRIGIVLVDNETIHHLNRDFLKHDCPTDVISFQVESDPDSGLLEGEVIVSVELAQERGPLFDWTVEEEVLLYVIHGLLHLVGYDDLVDEDREIMREKERFYLRSVGVEPTNIGFDEDDELSDESTFDDPAKNKQIYGDDTVHLN